MIPEPTPCHHCDFGSGYRGMDRCHVCDGTGSVFLIDGKTYPNTEEGYEAADAVLANKEQNL